jgi:hypothetical protein
MKKFCPAQKRDAWVIISSFFTKKMSYSNVNLKYVATKTLIGLVKNIRIM